MILCPIRPKSFSKEESELSKFTTHALEPVGEGFWEYLSRQRLGLSLAKDLELREAIETVEEETEEVTDNDDAEFINSLDPRDWKDQDHYLVLGCLKRFAATDDDLKRSCKSFDLNIKIEKEYLNSIRIKLIILLMILLLNVFKKLGSCCQILREEKSGIQSILHLMNKFLVQRLKENFLLFMLQFLKKKLDSQRNYQYQCWVD